MSETALGGGGPGAREAFSLWRHPAFWGPLVVVAAAAIFAPLWWDPLSRSLFALEFSAAQLLPRESIAGAAWILLPLLALAGGVLASVSPCVLPLIPLNVAAIGAVEATGWRAVSVSARFVLGAAAALSLLGLASDAAGFLLIDHRGVVLVASGLAMLYFGLVTLEIAPLPFAGRSIGARLRLGPIAAGAAFSLVTTPCASPLLAALLATAVAQQIPGLVAVTLLAFSLGYTALVFLAGVFGGSFVRRLRGHAFVAPRAASAALLLAMGMGFVGAGVAWF